MTVLNDLALWLWRLIPANPILVRVVTGGGRRVRHAMTRAAYLGLLIVAMLIFGQSGGDSLAALAKNSTQVFVAVSIVQLACMCLISPLFTAGAITQEKDGNTFSILLTTPLSNSQIVLGSLLSRLYFVWVLLLSGLPVFCISMIYGGVTTTEVFESFALAAVTGLVTGSLAIMIGMAKIGSRRTIFSFLVGVAVYLVAGAGIGMSPWGVLPEAPLSAKGWSMSWLAPIHPFLALFVITGQTPAPAPADVYHYGWPWRFFLAYPQYAYVIIMGGLSVLFIVLSLAFVRRGQTEGESTLMNRVFEFFARKDLGERRRKPRRVWSNPIAWRESETKASAGGRSVTRWIFIGAGVAAGMLLLVAARNSWWGITITSVRQWLTGLVWIEFAAILLVVTSTAASSLTREKESLTMELLLATRLNSSHICWGMLWGLVVFVLPMVAVPFITILTFVATDMISIDKLQTGVPFEAVILVPLMMTAIIAGAAIVGLQASLTSRKTVQAVMWSTFLVGIVVGLFSACGFMIRDGGAQLSAFVWPFMPFPSLLALIDPRFLFEKLNATPSAGEVAGVRWERAILSLISAGIYAGLTYLGYRNMVRNFDMTVRRQSA